MVFTTKKCSCEVKQTQVFSLSYLFLFCRTGAHTVAPGRFNITKSCPITQQIFEKTPITIGVFLADDNSLLIRRFRLLSRLLSCRKNRKRSNGNSSNRNRCRLLDRRSNKSCL